MAPRNKRTIRASKVSATAIDQVAASLDDLPERPQELFSLREAIEVMQRPLRLALDKGYTYEELVDILDGEDIHISASTLKRYLAIIKSDPADPSGGKRRKRRGAASEDEEAMALAG